MLRAGSTGTIQSCGSRGGIGGELGPRWTGPATAPPVARLLFVVFALHLAERRDDAVALLVIAAKVYRSLKMTHQPAPSARWICQRPQ